MKLLPKLSLGVGALALAVTGLAYGTGMFAYLMGQELEAGSGLEAELRHSLKISGQNVGVYGIDCPDFHAWESTVDCSFHRADGTTWGFRVYFEDDEFVYEQIDPKVERKAVEKQLAEVKKASQDG